MKKKFVSMILIAAVLALTACGSSASSSSAESANSTSADTASSSESAAESSSSGCEHDWQPAGYFRREYCSICGAERGDVKPDFFTEKNLTVSALPADPVTAAVLGYNTESPQYSETFPLTLIFNDCSAAASSENGFNTVTLSLTADYTVSGGFENEKYFDGAAWMFEVYDLYTGQLIPEGETGTDGIRTGSFSLELDGKAYDLSWSADANLTQDNDAEPEAGYDWAVSAVYNELVRWQVPQDYDGLVFALIPLTDAENGFEAPASADLCPRDTQFWYISRGLTVTALGEPVKTM